MTTSRLRAVAALAFAAFAATACGSSSTGPSYASAADSATIAMLANDAGTYAGNTLDEVFKNGSFTIPIFLSAPATRANATEFAMSYVQRLLARSTLKHSAPLPVAPAGLRLSAPFSQCTPTVTGIGVDSSAIDTDADGIPDDLKVDFGAACVSEDSAGTQRTTVSGYIRIQDTNVGLFSYKVTAGNFKIAALDLATTNSFSESINGSEAAELAAALAHHALDFTFGIAAKDSGTTVSLTYSLNENSSFDPDNGFNINPDSLPPGVFNFTADYRVVGENSGGEVPGNFHMALSTPTPLHYSPSCGNEIDSGVFRGLLNGNSNIGFTYTWSTCGNPVVEIFGDTPPAAVAAR